METSKLTHISNILQEAYKAARWFNLDELAEAGLRGAKAGRKLKKAMDTNKRYANDNGL